MPSIPWDVEADPTFTAALYNYQRKQNMYGSWGRDIGSLLRLKRNEVDARDQRLAQLARGQTYDQAEYHDQTQKAAQQSTAPADSLAASDAQAASQGAIGTSVTPGQYIYPGSATTGQSQIAVSQSPSENDQLPPATPVSTSPGTAAHDVQTSKQPDGSSPVTQPQPATANLSPVPATKEQSSETKPSQNVQAQGGTGQTPVTKPVMPPPGQPPYTRGADESGGTLHRLASMFTPDKYTMGEWGHIFGLQDPYKTQEMQDIGRYEGRRDILQEEDKRTNTLMQYGRPTNVGDFLRTAAPHTWGGTDLSGINWTDWGARHGGGQQMVWELALKAAGNDPAGAIKIYTDMMSAIRAAGGRVPPQMAIFQYLNSLPEGPEKRHVLQTLHEMQQSGIFQGYNPLMEMMDQPDTTAAQPGGGGGMGLGDLGKAALGLLQYLGIIPGENAPTGAGGAGGGKAADMSTIVAGLEKRGFTHQQAAAIAGNIEIESGGNAGLPARTPGEHGIGLMQWNKERLLGLQKYAASINKDYHDPEVQMDWIKMESNGDSKKFGVDEQQHYHDALQGNDPGAMAQSFNTLVERPENPAATANERAAAARRAAGTQVARGGGGGSAPAATPPAAKPPPPPDNSQYDPLLTAPPEKPKPKGQPHRTTVPPNANTTTVNPHGAPQYGGEGPPASMQDQDKLLMTPDSFDQLLMR